ncbi:aminomethyltransferase [Microdochium nivale]|nr:aminomethyltransferase [Microdochium nivale]
MRLQRFIGPAPKRLAALQQLTSPTKAAACASVHISTASSRRQNTTISARSSSSITTASQWPSPSGRRSYASSSPPGTDRPLQRTALYDLHLSHGAKMVPFGGFEMPVQYSGLGVSASHHFTRTSASLFDVGHMVQHRFEGPGAVAFLERVTPASLRKLPVHQGTLSTLLWPGTGGIVDDTVITKLADDVFYVVTNAACRDKDLKYLGEQLEQFRADNEGGSAVNHEVLDGWGLVALQGPASEQILSEVIVDEGSEPVPDLRQLLFGQSKFVYLKAGTSGPVLVSRAGYTGEDGFELSIHPKDTVAVTEALLDTAGPSKLQWAGLGARDSLRLEAGMCLYGHDLDDTTTPAEAALGWVVGKDRRDPGAANPFHGAEVVLPQLVLKSKGGKGVDRRRVGLVVEGAPAREGAEITDKAGTKIGVVTSGCPSPTLGKNIAMGYIKDGLHKSGTEVDVLVRGKRRAAVVTKMPFVPTQYWKGTAPA